VAGQLLPARIVIGRPAAAIFVVCLGVVACSSSSSTIDVAAPSATKCSVTAQSSPSSFGPAGGAGAITIATERECSWSAATDASWISMRGATSGQGDAAVPYSVTANPTPASRRATFVVASAQLEIVQDGAPCRFAIDRASARMSDAGGSIAVGVSAMNGCAWTASSRVNWIAVTRGAGGNGSGSVALTIQPNNGGERSGQVGIADQTVTVVQDAHAAPPPPAPPSPSPAPPPPPAPNPPAPSPPPPPPAPAPPPPSPAPAPPPPPAGQDIELKGTISGLGGSCPAIRFSVSGRTVTADSGTEFDKKPCRDLRNGTNVEVKGRTQSDGSVRASKIEAKDGDDHDG
jgi:uncharacterized protein DUF5666/all-beta uncharacterized protein